MNIELYNQAKTIRDKITVGEQVVAKLQDTLNLLNQNGEAIVDITFVVGQSSTSVSLKCSEAATRISGSHAYATEVVAALEAEFAALHEE